MSRCKGITRVGKRCSVTSSSGWADDHGRLVAGPLQKGGELCLFHAKPFCTKPTRLDHIDQIVVFMLDLETTGVDIVNDYIVEIAAVHAHGDIRMKGEAFSTTVCADPDVVRSRGKEAFKVHGITDEEIQQGPTFKEAWTRFLKWVDDVANNATKDSDSEDTMGIPMLIEDPIVVMVAHNGFRFDFPMLLCELLRNEVSTASFERWYFVDTIAFKTVNPHGCIKLQCMARDTMTDPGNAHRALDDCIALWRITNILAERNGIAMTYLLSMLLVEVDVVSSAAQLATLM